MISHAFPAPESATRPGAPNHAARGISAMPLTVAW